LAHIASPQQLDRLRMAGYAEKLTEINAFFEARRAVVGRKFSDKDQTHFAFSAGVAAAEGDPALRSRLNAAYERILSDDQKQSHAEAQVRGRALRAQVEVDYQAMLLSRRVAMRDSQLTALAKLAKKRLPPASAYNDHLITEAVAYTFSRIPNSALDLILAPHQVAAVRSELQLDEHLLRTLKQNGFLDEAAARQQSGKAAGEPMAK
jgi:hypothetical protein